MASQTESQKAGTEETKGMEKDKANRTVEEDKKSEDDTATNEQTDNKQTKIEEEDSEESEFEIIATEVVASTISIKLGTIEPIGPIVNIDQKSEEIAVSDDTKAEVKPSHNETCYMEENVAVLKENDKESAEASMIDIKIINESKDNSNKDVPESEAKSSDEVEEALTVIPKMSSSLSKEILAESQEAKKIIERIETKPEENQNVTLLDITIIEETNKENVVQDTTKEGENSFESEVIDDNADIQVVPSDGEDIIEYTIVAGDVIPFFTLVAFVAIILGLGYYFNTADNALGTQDVLEEQEQ